MACAADGFAGAPGREPDEDDDDDSSAAAAACGGGLRGGLRGGSGGGGLLGGDAVRLGDGAAHASRRAPASSRRGRRRARGRGACSRRGRRRRRRARWRRPCPARRRSCRSAPARVSSACFTARASRMPPWASSCCTSMFAASASARVSATRSFCAATAPCTTKPVPTMAPMAATAPAAMRGPRRQPLGLRLARRETAWVRTGSMEFSGVEEGWFCMTFTGRSSRGTRPLDPCSTFLGRGGARAKWPV